MPTYTFQNKLNGEEFILDLKMSEREPYLKSHPEIEQILVSLPHFEASMKPDSTFSKYVLGRMKEAIPGNTIGSKRFDVVREL